MNPEIYINSMHSIPKNKMYYDMARGLVKSSSNPDQQKGPYKARLEIDIDSHPIKSKCETMYAAPSFGIFDETADSKLPERNYKLKVQAPFYRLFRTEHVLSGIGRNNRIWDCEFRQHSRRFGYNNKEFVGALEELRTAVSKALANKEDSGAADAIVLFLERFPVLLNKVRILIPTDYDSLLSGLNPFIASNHFKFNGWDESAISHRVRMMMTILSYGAEFEGLLDSLTRKGLVFLNIKNAPILWGNYLDEKRVIIYGIVMPSQAF